MANKMRTVKYNITFIVIITMLSIGGLISTDIFLPAILDMSDYYKVDESSIQNAIAIFLLGISISQLIYGPLSDSFGRRKILLIGLVIWFFSTVGILLTNSIDSLLLLRFFQGVGSCAGITISKVIINDKMGREDAGHLYLIIFPFVGMSPAIAPMIGGVLNNYFGWKSCFVFLVVFIMFTLFLCFFYLEETLQKSKRHPFNISSISLNTLKVFSDKVFIYYALIPCFAYAAYFSYIVESPILLNKLGLHVAYIGYSYIGLSLSYVLGNIVAKKICKIRGIDKTIKIGYTIFVIGGVLFLLQMLLSSSILVTTILSISVLTFGNGFLLPLGTASAIASHKNAPGTASGVMGTLQLGSAAIVSFLIGYLSKHNPTIVAFIIASISILGFGIFMFFHSNIVNND
ncbi:multidrug effflux MFS transporter [Acinetobacter sp. C32I]|uniref:multidrug effflux MFS transporter n=1 Tax=Acinetobacter sp. C32I TaxID=2950074 RepID=UPI00203729E8|nr:multidrug effflux MFS transporter [Acinetobacter sp. C32I]USA55384.1 multidrug effflux MFS transporter [Acinetobacter sp. C32I]